MEPGRPPPRGRARRPDASPIRSLAARASVRPRRWACRARLDDAAVHRPDRARRGPREPRRRRGPRRSAGRARTRRRVRPSPSLARASGSDRRRRARPGGRLGRPDSRRRADLGRTTPRRDATRCARRAGPESASARRRGRRTSPSSTASTPRPWSETRRWRVTASRSSTSRAFYEEMPANAALRAGRARGPRDRRRPPHPRRRGRLLLPRRSRLRPPASCGPTNAGPARDDPVGARTRASAASSSAAATGRMTGSCASRASFSPLRATLRLARRIHLPGRLRGAWSRAWNERHRTMAKASATSPFTARRLDSPHERRPAQLLPGRGARLLGHGLGDQARRGRDPRPLSLDRRSRPWRPAPATGGSSSSSPSAASPPGGLRLRPGADRTAHARQTGPRRSSSTSPTPSAPPYPDGRFGQAIYLSQVASLFEQRRGTRHGRPRGVPHPAPGGIAIFSFLSYDARRSDWRYRPFLALLATQRAPAPLGPFAAAAATDLRRSGRFSPRSLRDAGPHMYWYRAAEAERELLDAGFELEAIGTTPQVLSGAMATSAAGLAGAEHAGTLYAVARR